MIRLSRRLHHRREGHGGADRRRGGHVQGRADQRRVLLRLVHLDRVEGELLLLPPKVHRIDHRVLPRSALRRQGQAESQREPVSRGHLDQLLARTERQLHRLQRRLERPGAQLAAVVGAPAEGAACLLAVCDAVRRATRDVGDVARGQEGNDAGQLRSTLRLLST